MRNELVRIARALGLSRSALDKYHDNQHAVEALADFAERVETHRPPTEIVYHYDELTVTEKPGDDGSSLCAGVLWRRTCGKGQVCGGRCILAAGHLVPCECPGDEPGCPGSCPA